MRPFWVRGINHGMINEERNNERKARIAKLRHPGGIMILKERGTEIGVEGQDTLDQLKKGGGGCSQSWVNLERGVGTCP